MPVTQNHALRRMRAGGLALGFGVQHLRGAAVPLLAQAGGFDWLFIDTEHGAMSVSDATQICLAALSTSVTPIVRICADALDEGTRALDNGAAGIVVPHVDTPEQARRVAQAFRYPPAGHRSWGGAGGMHGFLAPAMAQAQAEINDAILVVAMIESPEAVANAEAIAAVQGIDVLLIGTSDLSSEMGLAGQIGHPRVHTAYEAVAAACRRHGKILGMGGVYDEEVAPRYVALGAQMILSGSDQAFLLAAGTARSAFLRRLNPAEA